MRPLQRMPRNRPNPRIYIAWVTVACGVLVPALAMSHDRPRDYQDCIFMYMPGTKSDAAARSIESACRARFPTPQGAGSGQPTWPGRPPSSALPARPESLPRADVRDIRVSDRVRVRNESVESVVEILVQNGSSRWHVKEIELDADNVRLREDRFLVPVDIPPKSAVRVVFRMPPLGRQQPEFDVKSARGWRVN